MTNSFEPPPGWPQPRPRTVNGGAVALGIVLVSPTVAFFCLLLGSVLGTVVAGVYAIGSVALVARKEPFARGLGVGMLIGGAVCALLIGSCLALIAGIE